MRSDTASVSVHYIDVAIADFATHRGVLLPAISSAPVGDWQRAQADPAVGDQDAAVQIAARLGQHDPSDVAVHSY